MVESLKVNSTFLKTFVQLDRDSYMFDRSLASSKVEMSHELEQFTLLCRFLICKMAHVCVTNMEKWSSSVAYNVALFY